jgi:4-amino-4-deoxy-L-arabinose transferase-like glycosyltransferase
VEGLQQASASPVKLCGAESTARRLVAALVDPRRREGAIVGVLLAYVGTWTVYALLAKASQDMHYDLGELVGWAREPALGYAKHPPLAAWVVRAWIAVFPLEDWSLYLLGVLSAAAALWIAWRLSAAFLDPEKRVVGLALLTLVPFFNFHALKFNANTVLLPLWALTTLFFLRSYETRNAFYSALAGLCAAASMLGKYWSVFLLAGLGIAALLDPRRGAYFRSPAAWITAVVAAALFAPHFVWLMQHDFLPLAWAQARHQAGVGAATAGALLYCAGLVAYVAVPLGLMIVMLRPRWAAVKDSLRPITPERRLAANAFWLPLILPALSAPFLGLELTSLWAMPALTSFPILLLSSPLMVVPREAAVRIVAVSVAFPLLMPLIAPAVAFAIHVTGQAQDKAHYRLLADVITQLWRQMADRPLRLVEGQSNPTFGVAFYAPDRPSVLRDVDPVAARARLQRDGIALVCDATNYPCVAWVEKLAAGGRAGHRTEVTLSREFLGWRGQPATYLIITMPPL